VMSVIDWILCILCLSSSTFSCSPCTNESQHKTQHQKHAQTPICFSVLCVRACVLLLLQVHICEGHKVVVKSRHHADSPNKKIARTHKHTRTITYTQAQTRTLANSAHLEHTQTQSHEVFWSVGALHSLTCLGSASKSHCF
jgi:hypothetical protein